MVSATGRPVKTAGIVCNPHNPAAAPLGREIAHVIDELGVGVWVSDGLQEPDAHRRVIQTDLLITLGGDGTILRAARAAAGSDTLLLGVNLGRMGFLTEAEPGGWRGVIPRVIQGNYWIEERMMLRAEARRESEILTEGLALNDIVVGQGALSRVVRLEVRIDSDLLTRYVADAMIVATPTGSTAYALAAGGPIMPPQQRNILLVPVAPHLSLDRAVVLAEGVRVEVVVRGRSPASLTLDGQTMIELSSGDVVRAEASPYTARFARVRERDYFYRTLMARLVPRDNDVERVVP